MRMVFGISYREGHRLAHRGGDKVLWLRSEERRTSETLRISIRVSRLVRSRRRVRLERCASLRGRGRRGDVGSCSCRLWCGRCLRAKGYTLNGGVIGEDGTTAGFKCQTIYFFGVRAILDSREMRSRFYFKSKPFTFCKRLDKSCALVYDMQG